MESAQNSGKFFDKVEKGGRGGMKDWISKQLGGSKSDHDQEDKTNEGEQDSYGSANLGDVTGNASGVDIHPTTDSGEPVRSSDNDPPRTFHIPPLQSPSDDKSK